MEEIKNLLHQMAPKRPNFTLSIFLLGLLFLSVIFSFSQRQNSQKQNQFNLVYELTLHQLEQGKELIGLNNLRAVSLLSEARTNLVNLQKDFNQKSQQIKTIAGLLSQIDQELQSASQIYKISPEVFFDLTLLKAGGQGEKMGIASGQIFVTDPKNGVVYQIAAKTKAGKIIAEKDQPKGLQETKVLDSKENFNLKGLDKPLSSETLVFTNQDTVNSYVWDKSNKRVVIFDEKNHYQSQYQWGGNQNYSGMVALEDLKLIFLLDGSKIYSIKMSSPT